MSGMTGEISQRPPAFSAIKVGGRRAYAMARAGQSLELAERAVTIFAMDLLSWDASDPERPIAIVDVECSAGTYVRALARDLGERIGNAAYLGALRRTAAGTFDESIAIALDTVRTAAAAGPGGLVPLLLPIDAGLERFPDVSLTVTELESVARGQFIRTEAGYPPGAERYRLRAPDGTLAAIATASTAGRLAPDKVLVDPVATGSAAGA